MLQIVRDLIKKHTGKKKQPKVRKAQKPVKFSLVSLITAIILAACGPQPQLQNAVSTAYAIGTVVAGGEPAATPTFDLVLTLPTDVPPATTAEPTGTIVFDVPAGTPTPAAGNGNIQYVMVTNLTRESAQTWVGNNNRKFVANPNLTELRSSDTVTTTFWLDFETYRQGFAFHLTMDAQMAEGDYYVMVLQLPDHCEALPILRVVDNMTNADGAVEIQMVQFVTVDGRVPPGLTWDCPPTSDSRWENPIMLYQEIRPLG